MTEQAETPATGAVRQRFGAKGWHVTLVWTVCVAVVVGIVAGFGGFATRTDKAASAQPGEAVALNAVEVRVWAASVQSSDDPYWVITVQADVRNTSGQPLSASDLEAAIRFGYINGDNVEQRTDFSSMFIQPAGGSDETSPRRIIPPTDETFPVVFTVSVTDGLDRGKPMSINLYPVVYQQNTILGLSDQKEWVEDPDADHYWIVTLPITQI